MKFKKVWSVIKEILTTILIVFVVSLVINYIRRPELPTDYLPESTVRLIDNTEFYMHPGHPLILHFWAVWCPVCKMEAPNINWISKHYPVLTVVVNSGPDQKVMSFLKQHGWSFKVLNDTHNKWAARFRVHALPTTFIFDKKGKLRFVEIGYTTTPGLLVRLWWVSLLN